MIVLFTDFGIGSPYVAQMKAVIMQLAPNVPIIELFSDAPACNPRASAYLLPAYIHEFPIDTVFVCVVDPGVGDHHRIPVVVKIDNRWFVGPDNGLFNVLALRSLSSLQIPVQWWDIIWQPDTLSNSFHGRDLFAPVAAKIAVNKLPEMKQENDFLNRIDKSWSADIKEIIYIDHFGNAMTGMRYSEINSSQKIFVKNQVLNYARTFSDVPLGQSFWYENANGLVEIASNQARAAEQLSLSIGDGFDIR